MYNKQSTVNMVIFVVQLFSRISHKIQQPVKIFVIFCMHILDMYMQELCIILTIFVDANG